MSVPVLGASPQSESPAVPVAPRPSNAGILARIEQLHEECLAILQAIKSKEVCVRLRYPVTATPTPLVTATTAESMMMIRGGPRIKMQPFVGPTPTPLPVAGPPRPTFRVVELKEGVQSAQLLVALDFRSFPPMEAIDDVFNDKVNWQCASFYDVERLVKTLWPVAKKFSLFGEGDACKAPLLTFQKNYETLLQHCKHAREACCDQEGSSFSAISSALDRANAALEEAASAGGTFCSHCGLAGAAGPRHRAYGQCPVCRLPM